MASLALDTYLSSDERQRLVCGELIGSLRGMQSDNIQIHRARRRQLHHEYGEALQRDHAGPVLTRGEQLLHALEEQLLLAEAADRFSTSETDARAVGRQRRAAAAETLRLLDAAETEGTAEPCGGLHNRVWQLLLATGARDEAQRAYAGTCGRWACAPEHAAYHACALTSASLHARAAARNRGSRDAPRHAQSRQREAATATAASAVGTPAAARVTSAATASAATTATAPQTNKNPTSWLKRYLVRDAWTSSGDDTFTHAARRRVQPATQTHSQSASAHVYAIQQPQFAAHAIDRCRPLCAFNPAIVEVDRGRDDGDDDDDGGGGDGDVAAAATAAAGGGGGDGDGDGGGDGFDGNSGSDARGFGGDTRHSDTMDQDARAAGADVKGQWAREQWAPARVAHVSAPSGESDSSSLNVNGSEHATFGTRASGIASHPHSRRLLAFFRISDVVSPRTFDEIPQSPAEQEAVGESGNEGHEISLVGDASASNCVETRFALSPSSYLPSLCFPRCHTTFYSLRSPTPSG
eukprot:6206423-Pleurochrysis_carterae.AAC.4